MSLYPSILFHFTKKESLESILLNDFRPSYSRERFDGVHPARYGVPMVSFMDIKMSELKIHYNKDQVPKFKYGDYGVGLTKEWAVRNGLNPVIYNNPHNGIINDFVEACYYLEDEKDVNERSPDQYLVWKYVSSMMCFMKTYQGILERRDGTKIHNYRFADEREWRWVPNMEPPLVIPHIVNYATLDNSAKKLALDEKLNKVRLHFVPEDIRYLIVDSEEDILPTLQLIEKAKNRFPMESVNRLRSRIITMDQIMEDF